MMRLWIKSSALAALAFFLFSGCARQGPLLTDFRYLRSEASPAAASPITVAVGPFKDDRGKTGSVVGKRLNALNDVSNDLVVQGTVSDKVTSALVEALAARKIAAKDISLNSGAVPDGSDIVIGGEIKTFWIDSVSHLANTTATAEVRLRIVAQDSATGATIRVLNVNSKIERQHMVYSGAFVEALLSEALTAAINQICADEELKNRFK